MATRTLEERIQHLEDINEIQNLMSKYEYLHTAGMQEETTELFAKKTPGVKADIPGFGVYEGFEGIKRLYIGAHNYIEGDGLGEMFMHALTTSVIEVAGDGKTAKGVWISPGHETMKVGGKLQAHWAWCKYGVDFVKEDGQWKFWHFRVYGIFHTPYDKSWTKTTELAIDVPIPDELKPDRPSLFWTYGPTVKPEHEPAPPEPYETWDKTFSY